MSGNNFSTDENGDSPDPHEFCSVKCPCGHWNDKLRRPTTRADGRRGRPNLDVIEGNGSASR